MQELLGKDGWLHMILGDGGQVYVKCSVVELWRIRLHRHRIHSVRLPQCFLSAIDTIRFKGRELQHSDLGYKLMNKIKEDMKLVGKVEMNPMFDGKQMIMVIQPL